MRAIAAFLLAGGAIVVIYLMNLVIAGHSIHPSMGWLQTMFPSMWQRALLCGLPFSFTNIGIAIALNTDASWGSASLILTGILIPAAIGLWLSGTKPNAEIGAILVLITALSVWLGNALERAAS